MAQTLLSVLRKLHCLLLLTPAQEVLELGAGAAGGMGGAAGTAGVGGGGGGVAVSILMSPFTVVMRSS
jgi:hypothetical protein